MTLSQGWARSLIFVFSVWPAQGGAPMLRASVMLGVCDKRLLAKNSKYGEGFVTGFLATHLLVIAWLQPISHGSVWPGER